MVVLDTDCVIALLHNDASALKTLRAMHAKGERPCITSLTAFELLKGVQRSKNLEQERALLSQVISSFFVIDFGYLDADAAAELEATLRKRGMMIGTIDLLIAGICITTHQTLITRNSKHFENIPKLSVETW